MAPEKQVCVYVYIICIHTFIHSYIHTYIHTYIHSYMHTYIHTCTHACIHTYTDIAAPERWHLKASGEKRG